jgi:hypothetical protein
MFLKIENPGTTSFEFLSTLGLSSSRGNNKVIGQFGTGAMASIGILLRNQIPFFIYSGNLKFDFFVDRKMVNDGLQDIEFQQICCKISGKDNDNKQVNRTEKLNVAIGYGELDWDRQEMVCREFVSNAIDRVVKEHGEGLVKQLVSIEPIEDNQVRAKSGATRVFLKLTPNIEEFYHNLHKKFLHFGKPLSLKRKILVKDKLSHINEDRYAHIYKKGVFVRECSTEGLPSLFNYNFGDELKLDECRNADDYTARSTAAVSLGLADEYILVDYMKSLVSGTKYWEHTFDPDYLRLVYCTRSEQQIKDQADRWKKAYDIAFGDAILCPSDGFMVKRVTEKGYRTTDIPHTKIYECLRKFGIRSAEEILSKIEVKGNETVEVPECVKEIARDVWSKLEGFGLTNGCPMPTVSGYRKIASGGVTIKGLALIAENEIHLNDEFFGKTEDMYHTILHEFAHCITKSLDFTSDFQEFGYRLAVKGMFPNIMRQST